MNLNTIEKLEKKALQEAGAIWSAEGYRPELNGYYYFPEEPFLMIAINMIPPNVGFWECSCEECPDLFDSQPNCELGENSCQAEEIIPFVVIFEILKDKSTLELELGEWNHYHGGDFESEYVERDDLLDNYRISPSKIPTVNLPEFSTMMF